MLVRVCHLADCILATNFATASLVLDTLAAGMALRERPARAGPRRAGENWLRPFL